MMGIFKERKGVRCEPDENGVQRCFVYKQDKGEKLSTGTTWAHQLDDNCDYSFIGAADISQEDADIVKSTIAEAQAACRKGIR